MLIIRNFAKGSDFQACGLALPRGKAMLKRVSPIATPIRANFSPQMRNCMVSNRLRPHTGLEELLISSINEIRRKRESKFRAFREFR